MAAVERRRRRWLLCALTAPIVSLCACSGPGPFHHLEIREQTPQQAVPAPRLPQVELGATALRLVDGVAVQASVSALDDENRALPGLRLRSADPAVFDVTRAPLDGNYVFFGASPGSAELIVVSDGDEVGTIPVSVDPQAQR